MFLKSDSKNITVQNCITVLFQLMLFVNFLFNVYTVFQFPQKHNCSTTVFYKEMFLMHQISILEWFLKDHVTLKTGGMSVENSDLPSQEEN